MSKHYSKLYNSGSEGCIFIPELPCSNDNVKIKNDSNNTRSSKLLFRFDKTMENEYNINKLVKKINGYEKWAKIWDHKCLSNEYKILSQISEVDQCVDDNNVRKFKKIDDNTKFNLLQGEYKGITTNEYLSLNFTKKVFDYEEKFIEKFISLFKSLEYLFLGLTELYKHGICHHDAVSRNIIFYNDKFIFIDFGLSFQITNSKIPIKRMKKEFNNGRIYEAYPFEYIYYPNHDKKNIINEQEDIALKFHRSNYKDVYEFIHQKIYRRDIDYNRFEALEDKLHPETSNNINPIEMLKLLDIYSVGMLLFIMLIDQCEKLHISNDKLLHLLSLPKLKKYIDFLGKINYTKYTNRLNPIDAYNEYKTLI